MIEDRLSTFQRRLLDDRDEVVDADGFVDCLIEKPSAVACDLGATRMWITHQGIARSEDIDGITGQGWKRMGYRCDDADHAKRGEFLQRNAIFTAEGFGAKELHARRLFAGHDQLINLVFKAADLGFLKLLQAQLLGFTNANSADAVHGLPACF